MEVIDYLMTHSWDILRLATSFMVLGIGLICLYLCRVIYYATRLIKKANKVIDEINTYIRKPIMVMMSFYKLINKVLRIFGVGKTQD